MGMCQMNSVVHLLFHWSKIKLVIWQTQIITERLLYLMLWQRYMKTCCSLSSNVVMMLMITSLVSESGTRLLLVLVYLKILLTAIVSMVVMYSAVLLTLQKPLITWTTGCCLANSWILVNPLLAILQWDCLGFGTGNSKCVYSVAEYWIWLFWYCKWCQTRWHSVASPLFVRISGIW